MIGYETDRTVLAPRPGLRIRIVGAHSDLIDDGAHFKDAYGLLPDEWVLVRPDGYVGAIVGAGDMAAFERYLARVGLGDSARARIDALVEQGLRLGKLQARARKR